nr:retrovirus-related Pol polyprotein from transposon TNT 1-94 [Tanacetum cinerariifolium]
MGEIMQQFKQGLSGVTIIKEKGIWQGNATDDLDAFDSKCDEALGDKAVLMATLSNYNLDVIFKVPISDTNHDNSILDNSVEEMYYSKKLTFNPVLDIKITRQAFGLSILNPISEQLLVPPTPVKIEIPSKLPKVRLRLCLATSVLERLEAINGRTFTINGTKYPMTRITSNPIVPYKENIQTPVITPNLKIKVIQMRPLVLGLEMLQAYDRTSLSAHQLCRKISWYRKIWLKKALYGMKQAPRAWYDMLSGFLLSQQFSKGALDPILFTRKEGKDILMTKHALEILKKYDMDSSDSVDSLMVDKTKLDEDLKRKIVNHTHYRVSSMTYRKAPPCNKTDLLIPKRTQEKVLLAVPSS